MNEWMNERMNEWVSEWVNEWMSEWVSEWMNEWMNEWMSVSEWMNKWMNEWVNEWMNEWVSEWVYTLYCSCGLTISYNGTRPSSAQSAWCVWHLTKSGNRISCSLTSASWVPNISYMVSTPMLSVSFVMLMFSQRGHGRRSLGNGGDKSPKIWSGGIVSPPQILSCCKILSARLLASQCRKMCFWPLQQDFYSNSRHASPRIPVRSVPMRGGGGVAEN